MKSNQHPAREATKQPRPLFLTGRGSSFTGGSGRPRCSALSPKIGINVTPIEENKNPGTNVQELEMLGPDLAAGGAL